MLRVGSQLESVLLAARAASSPPEVRRSTPRTTAAWFVAWLVLAVTGFAMLQAHKSVPGTTSTSPAAWPSEASLARSAVGPTLLLFAHPKCPCTRATLRELELIQAEVAGPIKIVIVFTRPKNADNFSIVDWNDTDVVRAAKNFPGAEVQWDDDGATAALFDVHTSGQTLLYDDGGRLLFSGGITASRGHEGDNVGRRAIVGRAAGDSAVGQKQLPATTPVFGCPVFRRDALPPCDGDVCPPPA